jgi:dihydrofolate reductase
MRKLIILVEMSLDAVEDNPNLWGLIFEHHNDETTAAFTEQFNRTDLLIMGRITYESFAEVWPMRGDEDPIAAKMNGMPKLVASRTLKSPLNWNASLIEGDVVEAIRQAKQQPGQDIVQFGVGELTHTLLDAGLIDELRFSIIPAMVGSGQRVFDNIDTTKLNLLHTRTFSSGIIELQYQPKPRE